MTEKNLKTKVQLSGDEKRLSIISSAFMEKGVPARLTTFIFCLLVAVSVTFIIPDRKKT